MSTRAIVGYKKDDGKIIGAWNWNDGFDILDELEKDFKKKEDVDVLIKLGMFNNLLSKKEAESFKKWAKKQKILENFVFVEYKNSVFLQQPHYIGTKAVEYEDIEEVLAQDINVAYMFEEGKWKKYL